MRNLFKIAGLLALTGFISSCNEKETTANYQVIPLPQEITTAQSQPFTLNGSVKIIYPELRPITVSDLFEPISVSLGYFLISSLHP